MRGNACFKGMLIKTTYLIRLRGSGLEGLVTCGLTGAAGATKAAAKPADNDAKLIVSGLRAVMFAGTPYQHLMAPVK